MTRLERDLEQRVSAFADRAFAVVGLVVGFLFVGELAAFGAPRNGKGATGPFPKIRLLTLIASGTRTIMEAVRGPFATGELTLLSKLVGLGVLRPGMLVLGNRYFSGHPQLVVKVRVGYAHPG